MGQQPSTGREVRTPSLKRGEKSSPKRNFRKKKEPSPLDSPLRKSSSSGLVGNQSERESLAAWIREDVNVTDVYNVHEIIGHGHLGVITVVTRKRKDNGFSQHHRTSSNHSVAGSPNLSKKILFPSDNDLSAYSADDEKPVSGRPRLDSYASDMSLRKDRLYACKSVSTSRMQRGQTEELMNEIRIMRQLDHPHILHLFEVYYVKRRVWLITELCVGGDLFSRIDTNTELDVCLVMEQICRGIAYMHRRGVCHRDIKLENVLYEHTGPDARIKLIDFGLSQKFTRKSKMLRVCGTVYSVAPELVEGKGYSEMSDVWSIGCVAFILLSGGSFPFLTADESLMDEIEKNRLLEAKYEFGPEWDARQVSEEGKEFVRCCLVREPKHRKNAREILEFIRNDWDIIADDSDRELITKSSHSFHSINSDTQTSSDTYVSSRQILERRRRTQVGALTLQGMKEFSYYGQLKKRVLMLMAHSMDKSSIGELSELFIAMDTEGTGTISMEEMRSAIRRMYDEKPVGNDFSEKDIERMFKGIDQDRSGQIHYAEFLAAVLESRGLITMELLGEAFDRIDTEGKGFISKDDLRAILGKDSNEELVNRMLKEADFKKNGQVDYDEFLNLMFEDPADAVGMFDEVVDSIRSTDELEWNG